MQEKPETTALLDTTTLFGGFAMVAFFEHCFHTCLNVFIVMSFICFVSIVTNGPGVCN